MPTPAALLLAAALLPLAAFGVLLFGGKRIGDPLAGYIGAGVSATSFLASLIAMANWIWQGRYTAGAWGMNVAPINLTFRWLPIGFGTGVAQEHPGWLDVGLYIDSLTIAMFAMITLVALLVHVFSIGYMRGDERFSRYFAYLGLFCFSMLGLVIGGTLVQVFVFWELVGLCSYLLIGFWYERQSAAAAAMKAFITNRVGDFAFLVGIGILVYHLGNATLPRLWMLLGDAPLGGAVPLPDGSIFKAGLLTAAGLCLFLGAVGKSAQFPLHTWLPDAMAGPSPVSALIHAATMVAAGVYLVARIFWILTPDARLVIAIVGCVTLTMAALVAMAQTDIKRVLAWSTISQLGYMMLAIGIGSWVGGLFHLITHAFFKALLFLGAGSVIHAAGHHDHEMKHYGGLLKQIPVTAVTFGVGVLAIAGVPFFSGWYSKEMILGHAGAFASLATKQGGASYLWLLFILPTAAAYLTAFYMTRVWMLTFWGKPRNPELHEQARESGVMYWPLILLAAPAIIAGWRVMNVQPLIEGSISESQGYVSQLRQSANGFYKRTPLAGFRTAWPAEVPVDERTGQDPSVDAIVELPAPTASQQAHIAGVHLAHRYATWAPLAILLGVITYWRGYALVTPVVNIAPIRIIRRWLYHGMYVDALYGSFVVGLVVLLSRIGGWGDKYVIDGLVNAAAAIVRQASVVAGWNDRKVVDGAVDGVGRAAFTIGAAARNPASGRVRLYVTLLFVAVVIGGAIAVIAALAH